MADIETREIATKEKQQVTQPRSRPDPGATTCPT
jgi:hypothetical protein